MTSFQNGPSCFVEVGQVAPGADSLDGDSVCGCATGREIQRNAATPANDASFNDRLI